MLDIFLHQPTTLYFADALKVLPQMPAGSVHCVVTDAAYWTLEQHRKIGTTTRLRGHRDETKRGRWFAI